MMFNAFLFLASLASAAQVSIVLPATVAGDIQPSQTLSIVGAGKDGRTTYVLLPETTGTASDIPVTIIEGPSDVAVPIAITTTALGQAATISAAISCGLDGSEADCAVGVGLNGKQTTVKTMLPATTVVLEAVGATSLIGKPSSGGALGVAPAVGLSGILLVSTTAAFCFLW